MTAQITSANLLFFFVGLFGFSMYGQSYSETKGKNVPCNEMTNQIFLSEININ